MALVALAIPATAAFAPGLAQATSTAKTALIDEESVTTEDGITKEGTTPISLEQFAAENAGFAVTVRTGEEWEKMTAEEFAQYQVLIVGDPICSSTAVSAVESAKTWTPVVMGAGPNPLKGNRVLVGTDPEDHYLYGAGGAQPTEAGNPLSAGAEHLVEDGIIYAGGVEGATGVYFDTSCADLEEEPADISRADISRANVKPATSSRQQELEGPDGRDKTEVLDHLTTSTAPEPWTEDSHPPCGGSVQQIALNPAFDSGATKLEDSNIQGWGCSDHVTFPTFPEDWHALAVATDTETHPTCGIDPDTGETACGESYVLFAGRGIVASSEHLSLSPTTGEQEAGATHTHTVTATVTEPEPVVFAVRPAVSGGNVPAVGAKVKFLVTEQNDGVVGTCTTLEGAADPECETNAEGKVNFTYADVKGAGVDTINASVKLGETTEQATASMTWTPVAVVVATPAKTAAVVPAPTPKSGVLAFGAAHLASNSHACVASTGYLASVSGKLIASVTYALDGHKLKTLTHANSHGAFSLRIALAAGHVHHLTIEVAFTSASSAKALTLKRTLARCAAVHHVSTPRFTG
ncbi:MAG TPA: hypothetical protein VK790_02010 [Solirubrobacteraceae bacterium]|nr:hypothetical protein [Solirubrobacteraceae bacterium]